MNAVPLKAVVIGASAGALEALSLILPTLPTTFALPIFVVVHIPPDRRSVLTELFNAKCRLPVYEAEDKAPIVDGTIYFAPPDYHLLIETDRTLSLSSDEPIAFSRPAIDVLFETAADAYGSSLIAIILTGANEDGAKGIKAVCAAGGYAIVQNPREAQARAMPEAALAACPTAHVLSVDDIAVFLQRL